MLIRRSKAAAILGVHPNTLRNWEQAGIIKPALRMPKGESRFALADVERLVAGMNDVRAKSE